MCINYSLLHLLPPNRTISNAIYIRSMRNSCFSKISWIFFWKTTWPLLDSSQSIILTINIFVTTLDGAKHASIKNIYFVSKAVMCHSNNFWAIWKQIWVFERGEPNNPKKISWTIGLKKIHLKMRKITFRVLISTHY